MQILKRPPGKFCNNILLNLVYHPPIGDQKELEYYFKSCLSLKMGNLTQRFNFSQRININLLDFNSNKKVQNFANLVFHFGMIEAINKPM